MNSISPSNVMPITNEYGDVVDALYCEPNPDQGGRLEVIGAENLRPGMQIFACDKYKTSGKPQLMYVISGVYAQKVSETSTECLVDWCIDVIIKNDGSPFERLSPSICDLGIAPRWDDNFNVARRTTPAYCLSTNPG